MTSTTLSAAASRLGKSVARAARAVAVTATVALGLAALLLVVATPLETGTQALLGSAVFGVALALNTSKSRTVTLLLTITALAVTTRYMVWRATSTLPLERSLDLLFGGALFAAELFSFVVLVLGYFQTAHPLERKPAALPSDPTSWPSVDVFVPTYHEPLEVVRATVLAALELDWPANKLRVYVLDDGNRSEFRAFCASVGAAYLARRDNRGAKAGNINAALGKSGGEFVAVFDCDHVPTRSFLQMTMGWFLRDEKLAMVQTPHHFYSPDPIERNLRIFRKQPNEGELFYGLLQPGNDLWNAAFFCGSCAVMRRTALERVGGVAVETVTEDAHTALRLHRCGYTTAFIGTRQAAGLATESLAAHIRQRIRWARGMAQIFRVDNPLLGRGLTVGQRLCYLNALLYFFCGLPRLIFLTAPLGFLMFDAHIFNAAPALVLAYALPHLAHTILTSSRIQGGYRSSFWGELYETVLSVYIVVPTALALVNPRAGGFNVTAKGGLIRERYFDFRIAAPFLVLLGLNAAGVACGAWSIAQRLQPVDAVLINIGWAVYNILLLSATVAAAFERPQRRAQPRVELQMDALLSLSSGRVCACELRNLSLTGAALSCAVGEQPLAGEELTATLLMGRDALPFPAKVVRSQGGDVQVQLGELSMPEQASLVRALFCRADAWSRWSAERTREGPITDLLGVFGHGLRGLWQLVRAPRFWRSRTDEVAYDSGRHSTA